MSNVYTTYVEITGINPKEAHEAIRTLVELRDNVQSELRSAKKPDEIFDIYTRCTEILESEHAFMNRFSDLKVNVSKAERLLSDLALAIDFLDLGYKDFQSAISKGEVSSSKIKLDKLVDPELLKRGQDSPNLLEEHYLLDRAKRENAGSISLSKAKWSLQLARTNVWLWRALIAFVIAGLVVRKYVSDSFEGWIYLALAFLLWILWELLLKNWMEKFLSRIAKRKLEKALVKVFDELIWVRLGGLYDLLTVRKSLEEISSTTRIFSA